MLTSGKTKKEKNEEKGNATYFTFWFFADDSLTSHLAGR